MRRFPFHAAVAAASVLAATPVSAQVQLPDDVRIHLTGRLHAQFNTTSVDGESSSEFLIRRARLGAEVDVGRHVTAKIEPDFGEGGIDLKDAWVRLNLDPAFRISAGQFKRPFDLFELTSSNRILVVERAGGIRGVADCSGPGGVCSLSRLTEQLQFADRDIGVLFDGTRGSVSWAAAITNGAGANTSDENGSKSFTGRLELAVQSGVVIAISGALHDYVHLATGDDQLAHAVGIDAELGTYAEGPHLQAGIVVGENWLNPISTDAGSTFFAAQTIITHRKNLTRGPITGIEPLVRLSLGNPDTDASADHGWLLTPGVNLHFVGRTRLALNVDVWLPDVGAEEWSFKGQAFFYF